MEDYAWAKHISFEDFCEYILPYRCTSTYSEKAQTYFSEKYKKLADSCKNCDNFQLGSLLINKVNDSFSENPGFFTRYPYLQPVSFSNLLKGKIGDCKDINSVRVTALRSLGVPATLDQIPNWGNSNSSHYWYKIVDPLNDTIRTLITNKNSPKETQYLISGSSYDLFPLFAGIPEKVVMNYVRTVPKIYRLCFSRQVSSLAMIRRKQDPIPSFFENDRLKDVTDDYVKCANVTIALNDTKTKHNFAYLCVYDNKDWKPVAWATVKEGVASFKKMGRNIVYLPAYYNGSDLTPAGAPFLLALNGKVENLSGSKKNETVSLYMKYPYRIFVQFWQSSMIGGRFQVANKEDFSDSVTVHNVKKLPFYQMDLAVKPDRKYRFFLFRFRDSLKQTIFSEIQFFRVDGTGQYVKIKGRLIGNPGVYPNTIDKIDDGVRNSYMVSKENSEHYVGIDVGKGNECNLSKISYTPRDDDNGVINGESYELFYWKNGWIYIGNELGSQLKKVTFKNVPTNALLLLKNVNGGTENRIFTYQQGKQYFW